LVHHLYLEALDRALSISRHQSNVTCGNHQLRQGLIVPILVQRNTTAANHDVEQSGLIA
jgi:hypothetical protein